jgi:hypothetical protein
LLLFFISHKELIMDSLPDEPKEFIYHLKINEVCAVEETDVCD